MHFPPAGIIEIKSAAPMTQAQQAHVHCQSHCIPSAADAAAVLWLVRVSGVCACVGVAKPTRSHSMVYVNRVFVLIGPAAAVRNL